MENRQPIDVKRIQLIYNALHLAINFYFFYRGAKLGWLSFDSKAYSYRCQPVDFSMHGGPLEVRFYAQLVFIIGLINLLNFSIRLLASPGFIISANLLTSLRLLFLS
jgi:hypothetical protein